MGLYSRGENWFIDYRVGGRRIRERIGSNKRLAKSILAKRLTEIAENRFLDVRKVSRETFGAFSGRYLEWVIGRIRTTPQEKSYIKRLLKTFGRTALADIDVPRVEKYMAERLKEPKEHPYRGRAAWNLSEEQKQALVEKWRAKNNKTISKSQVNREVSCLRRILNKAVAWKLIPGSPVNGVKLFDEREFIRKRYLKPEELKSLLRECSSHIRNVVLFALYTGRRFGEIINMRWEDVDLENGYVYFPRTKKKEPDQVALPPRAVQLLTILKESKTDEWVFQRRRGGRLRDLRKGFKRALIATEIKNFRFHDLRHTAISYMIMNGIDLKTVAELVGHTTSDMVDKRYGHLSPNHKLRAAKTYGAAMDKLCGFKGRLVMDLDGPSGLKLKSELLGE